MRKDMKIVFLLSIAMGLLALFGTYHVKAETGWENAQRISVGETLQTRQLTGSSVTPTALFSASFKRPDAMCLNNSSNEIWLGTTTEAGASNGAGVPNSNIQIGIPVLASSTFRLGGSMTGSLSFNCTSGIASCDVRCLDGVVQ